MAAPAGRLRREAISGTDFKDFRCHYFGEEDSVPPTK